MVACILLLMAISICGVLSAHYASEDQILSMIAGMITLQLLFPLKVILDND